MNLFPKTSFYIFYPTIRSSNKNKGLGRIPSYIFYGPPFSGKSSSFLKTLINFFGKEFEIPSEAIIILDFDLEIANILQENGYHTLSIQDISNPEKLKKLVNQFLYEKLDSNSYKILIFDEINEQEFRKLIDFDFNKEKLEKFIFWIIRNNLFYLLADEISQNNIKAFDLKNPDEIFEELSKLRLK